MNRTFRNLGPLTDAQRALVEAHLEWGVSGAMKYRQWSGRLFTLEELTSAAHFGLCMAAQRFDPSRGLSFKTYAMPWTESYLRRAFGDVRKANGGKYRSEGGVEPVLRRVAWPTDEDGHPLDVFPAAPVDVTDTRLRRQQKALVLACASTPRDRAILLGRLNGESNAQIGRRLGVSGSYVRNVWPVLLERVTRRVRAVESGATRQWRAA